MKAAAVFIGWQDMIDEPPEAMYNITGDHDLRGSTVSFLTLRREGIDIPDTPPPPAQLIANSQPRIFNEAVGGKHRCCGRYIKTHADRAHHNNVHHRLGLAVLALTLTWASLARANMNQACEGPDGVMSTEACDNQVQPEFKTYTPAQFAQITHAAPADTVIEMVQPITIEGGLLPKVGSVVSVNGMVPFQKVDGGYLIRLSPYLVKTIESAQAVAFLKTNKTFAEGEPLGGPVKFSGRYEYTSLTGYRRTVLAFKEARP